MSKLVTFRTFKTVNNTFVIFCAGLRRQRRLLGGRRTRGGGRPTSIRLRPLLGFCSGLKLFRSHLETILQFCSKARETGKTNFV
jgi:hypothetical protein